jgi:hypothetical protein
MNMKKGLLGFCAMTLAYGSIHGQITTYSQSEFSSQVRPPGIIRNGRDTGESFSSVSGAGGAGAGYPNGSASGSAEAVTSASGMTAATSASASYPSLNSGGAFGPPRNNESIGWAGTMQTIEIAGVVFSGPDSTVQGVIEFSYSMNRSVSGSSGNVSSFAELNFEQSSINITSPSTWGSIRVTSDGSIQGSGFFSDFDQGADTFELHFQAQTGVPQTISISLETHSSARATPGSTASSTRTDRFVFVPRAESFQLPSGYSVTLPSTGGVPGLAHDVPESTTASLIGILILFIGFVSFRAFRTPASSGVHTNRAVDVGT